MIEKIYSFDKLSSFKTENIYTVRIKSLAQTYGFGFSFASFYRQKENGEVTAVFSVLDADVTLAVDIKHADTEELAEFFSIRGFSSLMCSDDFELDCEYENGIIMSCSQKFEIFSEFEVTKLTSFEQLNDLYSFLEYGGSFDAWYTDIRRRINKNTAVACGVFISGKLVSSAILSSVYNSDAVLTGVKTDEKYHRKGLAGEIVKTLCNCVDGNVYLMREDGKNEKFYKDIGFKNIDRWRIYT